MGDQDMSVIDKTMDTMISALPREKREAMMIDMMPLMMEGIDMNELMPRMMSNMLEDVTVDDIVRWLKDALKDKERLARLGAKLQEANLMGRMMFRIDHSRLNFEETVEALTDSAEQNGWTIPDTRDLQREYHEAGLTDMTPCTILYFCSAEGGYAILTNSDRNKALSVMMPMGVSVYETTEGQVEIAAMNLGLMGNFFSGVIKDILKDGGERYEKSLEVVKQINGREARG
jgi:uncharacterized protein (DUF302 family)